MALSQLAEWGNLESQPDTARVSSIEDFYRARFLYRLSVGGEAVEAALTTFAHALQRRGELQTVALEDIFNRLQALPALAGFALGEPELKNANKAAVEKEKVQKPHFLMQPHGLQDTFRTLLHRLPRSRIIAFNVKF